MDGEGKLQRERERFIEIWAGRQIDGRWVGLGVISVWMGGRNEGRKCG